MWCFVFMVRGPLGEQAGLRPEGSLRDSDSGAAVARGCPLRIEGILGLRNPVVCGGAVSSWEGLPRKRYRARGGGIVCTGPLGGWRGGHWWRQGLVDASFDLDQSTFQFVHALFHVRQAVSRLSSCQAARTR